MGLDSAVGKNAAPLTRFGPQKGLVPRPSLAVGPRGPLDKYTWK